MTTGTDFNLLVRCSYCATGNDPGRGTCSQCGGPLPLERSWIVGEDEDEERIDPIEAAEGITALMFRDVAPSKAAGVLDHRTVYKLTIPAGLARTFPYIFPRWGVLSYFAITSRDPEPFFRIELIANMTDRIITSPVLRAPVGISPMVILDNISELRLVIERPGDHRIDLARPLDLWIVLMLWRREDGRPW